MADLEPIGITPGAKPGKAAYRRIATEEAFCPPEMFDIYGKILDGGQLDDPGFNSLWGFYLRSPSPRTTFIRQCMTDVGEQRLRHMDESGIDTQILSLTGPGVQVMDRETATPFATFANDWLAERIAKHPTRFAGLAACAPGPVRDRICMSMPEASMCPRRWSPRSVMHWRMKVVRGLGLFR